MGKILKDAKQYYPMFFDLYGVFNNDMAASAFKGLEQVELRVVTVKKVYEFLMQGKKSTEAIRLYVTSSMSASDVALKLGRNSSTVKSEFFYLHQCIGEYLTYNGDSLIRACLMEKVLNGEQIKNQLVALAMFLKNKQVRGNSVLNRRNLLINIPKSAEAVEVSDAEWEEFVGMIKPYIIAERIRAQKKINAHQACGYFNYIMSRSSALGDKDRARRDQVLALCDEEVLKRIKEDEEKTASLATEDLGEVMEDVELETDNEDFYIDI